VNEMVNGIFFYPQTVNTFSQPPKVILEDYQIKKKWMVKEEKFTNPDEYAPVSLITDGLTISIKEKKVVIPAKSVLLLELLD